MEEKIELNYVRRIQECVFFYYKICNGCTVAWCPNFMFGMERDTMSEAKDALIDEIVDKLRWGFKDIRTVEQVKGYGEVVEVEF